MRLSVPSMAGRTAPRNAPWLDFVLSTSIVVDLRELCNAVRPFEIIVPIGKIAAALRRTGSKI